MIYRKLTYRAKSIAVKAVSMMITFHPNMPMWNFYILLFVSNGSKKNCKNNGQLVKKENITMLCQENSHMYGVNSIEQLLKKTFAEVLQASKVLLNQNTLQFCISQLRYQGLFTMLFWQKSQHNGEQETFQLYIIMGLELGFL